MEPGMSTNDRPTETAAPTFKDLLEFDAIRCENHCDAICAYEEDCDCFREFKGDAEWKQ
jgi:hypothetical protein